MCCDCNSEHELLRDEVATIKAAKDKLNAKVVELEEEARNYKEVIEVHKQRSPSEDEVSLHHLFDVEAKQILCSNFTGKYT